MDLTEAEDVNKRWEEYWSGLPFPFSGDLPNSGIEFESLESPAYLQVDSLH